MPVAITGAVEIKTIFFSVTVVLIHVQERYPSVFISNLSFSLNFYFFYFFSFVVAHQY